MVTPETDRNLQEAKARLRRAYEGLRAAEAETKAASVVLSNATRKWEEEYFRTHKLTG